MPRATPPIDFMPMQHTATLLLRHLLSIALAAVVWASCANPGSGPDGGPYDETPPRIVAMSPALGTANASTNKVTISFNELVKVENAQEKIIVSPPQIEMPEIKVSGRHISVQLMDSLRSNTTYTVDFSDAIVDSNEGNPLGNFTYYFSTGQQVDTMEVAGHVISADDLEPVKGVLVGLHSNMADSAFTTLPFDRVARTDGNGRFCIKGVAPGSYRIYALKDIDNDFRYTRGEMLAFSRDTIIPSSFADTRHDTLWADTVHIDTIRAVPFTHYMPDNVVLTAFTESNISRHLLKAQREPAWFRVFFTAPSSHTPVARGLNFDDRDAWMLEHTAGNDTLTYWLRDTTLVNQDSLSIALTYEATDDSTGVNRLVTDTLELVPQFGYARRQKLHAEEMAKFEKERAKRHKRGDFSRETPEAEGLRLKFASLSNFSPDRNIHFSVDEPLTHIDTAGIHLFLQVDSTFHKAPFRLSRDTLSLLNYTIRAEWRPGQNYVINVDSASIRSLSGKINNNYDARFSIGQEESYGSLFLLIPEADTSAVVQLVTGGKKVAKQVKAKDGRADFFYLQPGVYYVRLFNDRNGNGIWDPGCYAEGRQAEEVYYYPSSFEIRPNWDIEQTWRLHAVPLDQQKPRELIKQKEQGKRTPQNRNAERERQRRG